MNKEEATKNFSSFFTLQNISSVLSTVLLAFLLWLFVKSEDEYIISSDIPLDIRNLPDNFVLSEEVPKNAKVQIKGQGRSLFKAFLLKRFFPEFKLILDIERISEEYNFVLNEYFDRYPQKVIIPSSFDISFIEVIDPISIRISLDQYKEKQVSVKSNISVIPKLGYTLVGNPVIKPEYVKIAGATNLVKNINYVFIGPDSILEADKDVSILVNLNVPPGKVFEYDNKSISFEQGVQLISERIISEIPVKILNPDSQLRIFASPQTVSLTVVGGEKFISKLETSEIEVSVDFNNWNKEKQFYEVKVQTPKDVLEWMDLSPMNIELLVTQKNN